MQNNYALPRTQRIIEHLEGAWQQVSQPSSDDLKKITEYIVSFPNPYKKVGLQALAEQTISNMELHMLHLMMLLQEKAEQEGIDTDELEEIFAYVKPEVFQLLEKLSKFIVVQSLDDLAALVNISTRLQTLSTSYTAQEAQSWLFELPDMYYRQLTKEGILIETDVTDVAVKHWTKFANWSSYVQPYENDVPELDAFEMTVPTKKAQSPTYTSIPLEPNKWTFSSSVA